MNTALEFSESRKEIGKALLKAQAALGPLLKTESNPYFKSKYADLSAVVEAVKGPLHDVGIVFLQGASCDDTGRIHVETMFLHAESGEWVRSVLGLKPTKDEPQPAGSALTYARRYGLQTLAGLAPEDDDGNAASREPVRESLDPVADLTSSLADLDPVQVRNFLLSRPKCGSPDGSLTNVSPEYARNVLNALPTFRATIKNFRQNVPNGTEPAKKQEVAASADKPV